MRLSVIVTTYNRPEALIRVLDGLRRQHCLPDEVIVADDGSGPATADAIGTFIGETPYPLYHVWQPDTGFRAAAIRNKAIRRAQGDYILLLDGDCIPSPRFVDDHLRLAEAGHFFQGHRILVSRRLTPAFEADRITRAWRLWLDWLGGHLGNGHHLVRLTAWPARRFQKLGGIRSCNMGLFTEDLYAVNGFNEDFVGWGREDSELAVRLFRFGLHRKSHPFMAVCFHLWHAEHDRSRLAANDDRLQQQLAADGFTCANGLVRRDAGP